MADAPQTSPAELLKDASKLELFACLRYTRDPGRIEAMLSQHLTWMAGQERAGSVFLSGPMPEPVPDAGNGSHPNGLTVVRAADRGAAEALLRTDPLVAAGVVDVVVRAWTVNEGCLRLSVSLSNSRAALS